VPGTIIYVQQGLVYASSSFGVRSQNCVLPLWQHWLMGDQEFQMGNQKTTYILESDAEKVQPVNIENFIQRENVKNR